MDFAHSMHHVSYEKRDDSGSTNVEVCCILWFDWLKFKI